MCTPLFAVVSAALIAAGLACATPRAGAAADDAGAKSALKPEVAALINQATATYKNLQSYQHTAVMAAVGKGPQGDFRSEVTYTLALERPNKFAYRVDQLPEDAVPVSEAVCDGKTFFNYRLIEGHGKQYIKTPAPATYKEINIVDDVLFEPLATYVIALMLQGDALADKDVRAALEKATLRPNVMEGGKTWQVLVVPFGPNEAPYEFYFDSETHRLARAVTRPPRREGQRFYIESLTETVDNVSLNKPVDASVFQYAPPEDAREVKKFSTPGEQPPGTARRDPRGGRAVRALSSSGWPSTG